jgi:hypothetical protein
MFMQEKFNNARGIIFVIGVAVLAVIAVAKYAIR